MAEPDAQAAAEDHPLGVEQVDGGGDARPEGLDGPVDDLVRELVAALERSRPHAARQARPLMLLHQLEEVGLAALLDQPLCVEFHGGAPGVGLHAAAPPAGAARPAHLHDHVADLTGPPASRPRLAREDQPAADTRAPEDAEQGAVEAAGSELELGERRHLDVVAEPHLGTELRAERVGERVAAFPAGQVAGADHVAVLDRPGRADPYAGELRRFELGRLGCIAHRRRQLPGDVLGAAAGRRGPAGRAEHGALLIDDDCLDLGPAEVDPAVGGHARLIMADGVGASPEARPPRPLWLSAASGRVSRRSSACASPSAQAAPRSWRRAVPTGRR